MLFWLKKIVGLFFLPLQSALIIGGLGTLFIWMRKREKLARAGRIMVTLAFAILALAANRGIALRLARPLESQFAAIPDSPAYDPANPLVVPTALADCKYVVVLGSGHGDDPGRPRLTQLSQSGLSRIIEGVRIIRMLPPDTKLVVSGYSLSGISHAQVAAEAAMSLGISPERIIRMDDTMDTDDEIKGAVNIAGTEKFALVTSAWHMPRAMDMCSRANANVIPCPTDYLLPSSGNEGAVAFLRFELGAFECTSKAIRERIGRIWAGL